MNQQKCPECGLKLTLHSAEGGCPSCTSSAVDAEDTPLTPRVNPEKAHDVATSGPQGEFQTTHWSLLLIAIGPDSPQSQAAMEELCRIYWYPVYAFIRGRGYSADQAKDFTQDLFWQILRNDSFAVADKNRGRFRSFLRTCAQNLINQHWQRENAQKRGGGHYVCPFDETLAESLYTIDQKSSLSPDELFERRWALSLLDQAMQHLQREFKESGRQAQFEALRPFLSGAKEAPESSAKVGESLGMTESAVRKAAQRMRQRFGELLRQKVAQTVASPSEVEDEMRFLRKVLSR